MTLHADEVGQTVPGLGPSFRLSPDRRVNKAWELKLLLHNLCRTGRISFGGDYQTGWLGMVLPNERPVGSPRRFPQSAVPVDLTSSGLEHFSRGFTATRIRAHLAMQACNRGTAGFHQKCGCSAVCRPGIGKISKGVMD